MSTNIRVISEYPRTFFDYFAKQCLADRPVFRLKFLKPAKQNVEDPVIFRLKFLKPAKQNVEDPVIFRLKIREIKNPR